MPLRDGKQPLEDPLRQLRKHHPAACLRHCGKTDRQGGVSAEISIQLHQVRQSEEEIRPAVVVEIVTCRRLQPVIWRVPVSRPEPAGRTSLERSLRLSEIPEQKKREAARLIIPETTRSGFPSLSRVAEVHAHAGDGVRRHREKRRSGLDACLFEGAVAACRAKQEVANRVIRHEHVGEAVAVEVGERDAHSLAIVWRAIRRTEKVGKRAVAVVVIERVGQACDPYSGWQ